MYICSFPSPETITNIVFKILDNFKESNSQLVDKICNGVSFLYRNSNQNQKQERCPFALFEHYSAHSLHLTISNETIFSEVEFFLF